MASPDEHDASSGASAEALPFWQWFEVMAQDASTQQGWQALAAQEREGWLLEQGFQLEEVRRGLDSLSRVAVITPAVAQAAKAWLEEGLMPAEQHWLTLVSLTIRNITDMGRIGGGGSYPVEHPIRRWRADRSRWAAELNQDEESLGRRELNEHTEIRADAIEAKETWHFLQREDRIEKKVQNDAALSKKAFPWLSEMETKDGRNEWYQKQLFNKHLVVTDTWEQIGPNDYVETPTWYSYSNAKAWPGSNGDTTLSLNVTWQRSTANLDGGANSLTISFKIEGPEKTSSLWVSRDNISKSDKKGDRNGLQMEVINYEDWNLHIYSPSHLYGIFNNRLAYIKKERNIIKRASNQAAIAKASESANKQHAEFDAFQATSNWRSATIWERDRMLLHAACVVHKRAESGSEIARYIQQRAIASAIGQEVKDNLGNPVVLIPAAMAANKQRMALANNIQTQKAKYKMAVAASLNKNGSQKYSTNGQLELQNIHQYWDEGVARDQYILNSPRAWINSYEKNSTKHQYEWSSWIEQSETLFYNSEKNAFDASSKEYKDLTTTGKYTKRQARNIATAYYFDTLAKEDVNWAKKIESGLGIVEIFDMGIFIPVVIGAGAVAYAPGVLRRQIRVAKWVVYTDRHPFLWQSKLKFKIVREVYLNKAINKWYDKELDVWSREGFVKKSWHFTEHMSDIFLKTVEKSLGSVFKLMARPIVYGLNSVSKLWGGGHLGTRVWHAESIVWHTSWYIFDRILKNTVLLPYRLSRSFWRIHKQFSHWLANGAHPKGFWDGLKKDTRSLQHLFEDLAFATVSLVTWGHGKHLMPHTAHRLHQEWQLIKLAGKHPKIFQKQDQRLLRLETKEIIRIDAIALKSWHSVAKNTALIESPIDYFVKHEWHWISQNKPKQFDLISKYISRAKDSLETEYASLDAKFKSETLKLQLTQLDKIKKWRSESSVTKHTQIESGTRKLAKKLGVSKQMISGVVSYAWLIEKEDFKDMVHSAQERCKNSHGGKGMLAVNFSIDQHLLTALYRSSRHQRRALVSTWAAIMALPTIVSNLQNDIKQDEVRYKTWHKKFMQITSYDWSGMGANEGLSITQSLVNAFVFSITSTAIQKKIKTWTKGKGKGDGLRAFRLIILSYMAPNIQFFNQRLKNQYSLFKAEVCQKYQRLSKLDQRLLVREMRHLRSQSKIEKTYAKDKKYYNNIKKMDRKIELIQRLGRIKITEASLKNVKQSWQDETLLVPLATMVSHSKRWLSLTTERQATDAAAYTKWLTTNQDKKNRTLKKDINRTKETSSELHTQQQAWSSDQAAIMSGQSMTVGQIVLTMKPIGNPGSKHPTSWDSVSTPDVKSIQAGFERQLGSLANVPNSGGKAPPTPKPAPSPDIKPVQLLTLYFQIKHFDLVYRRINRAIDKYWYGLNDEEIKGLSDAEVKKLKELGWSDEKIARVRDILKTDSGPWQDIESIKYPNGVISDLDELSDLEREQLEDILLARDGRRLKVARESLRLENEAAEAGEQEVLNVAERDVSHAVMDQFAPNTDDVLIDLEANTVEQIDEAATGGAADEEAAIQAEEAAVDETIDETIEAADIAIL